MKRICCLFILLLTVIITRGQNLSFGKITITPYITEDAGLDATATRLLKTKLGQIVTVNDAVGGFERRFVIIPSINVLSENETETIPQKTSMKVNVTFFVGDGVAGTLFNSRSMEISGVGDTHNEALYSAIKKIDIKDVELQTLIKDAKGRIVEYFNTNAPALIKVAEGYMAAYDYESALTNLAAIPAVCQYYDKAQLLISKCGSKIIERDNNSMLTKAKAAWSANPDLNGAKAASDYLSQVVISSSYYSNEVNKLTRQMQQHLAKLEDKKIELEEVKILSSERLQAERIRASARVTSSIFNALPKVVYNIVRWF